MSTRTRAVRSFSDANHFSYSAAWRISIKGTLYHMGYVDAAACVCDGYRSRSPAAAGGRLERNVNLAKSKAAPMSECSFPSFTIRGTKIRWTDKSAAKFKHRVKELKGRSWGVWTWGPGARNPWLPD